MAFCGAFGLLPAGIDWAVSACVTVVCALAAAKLGGKNGCGWIKYSCAEQRKMSGVGL